MDEYESLSRTKWECKYHVVLIPKCLRKRLYGNLRKHLGECSANWPSRRRAGLRRATHAPAKLIVSLSRGSIARPFDTCFVFLFRLLLLFPFAM
jgi:hypothetical protein